MDLDKDIDYFLCLPKHEKTCLSWLNGCEAQTKFGNEWQARVTPKGEFGKWFNNSVWTKDTEIRIKPSKEKRWIAYSANQKRLGCLSFDSEQEVRAHYIHEVDEPQFIEIEVEV